MRALLGILLLFPSLASPAQDWERIKADGGVIWAEGWGSSVEEADREALAALSSRISVGITSDFRNYEEQFSTPSGTEYRSRRSSSLRVVSTATLSNTGRIVLRGGRRAHVGRWIRRSELEAISLSREQRILEYEAEAEAAERGARVGDALRYHYWAYALLRSVQQPSGLRDGEGRMLLNTIPERMNRILGDLEVSAVKDRGRLLLSFRYRGMSVESLSFTCFTGAGWSPVTEVRDGRGEVALAPGALSEVVQLRIEYRYEADAALDAELPELLSTLESRPLRKSQIIFRR